MADTVTPSMQDTVKEWIFEVATHFSGLPRDEALLLSIVLTVLMASCSFLTRSKALAFIFFIAACWFGWGLLGYLPAR